jgi:hypothetical protein
MATSGYIVKTGTPKSGDYLYRNSGFTTPAPKGNLNTNIPSYSSASIDYSQPKKTNLVGDIVRPAR